MNDTKSLFSLLQQIRAVRTGYEDALKKTGEDWNIFYAIGQRTHLQELLHSYFIAQLLSPQHPAQKGNLFLKLFLETLAQTGVPYDFTPFYTGTARVTVEKYIGKITPDYERGGRIDILIEKGAQQVIIENKVLFADDQPKQLYRYRKAYPHAALFYLTLSGRAPDPKSSYTLAPNEYTCISYREHILKWLDKCLQATQGQPSFQFLHAAVEQYKALVSNLTGQGRIATMNEEMIAVLSQNKENLAAARDAYSHYLAAEKRVLQTRLFEPLAAFAKKRFGPSCELKTREQDGHVVEFFMDVPGCKFVRLRFDNEAISGVCGAGLYGLGFVPERCNAPQCKPITDYIARHIAPLCQTQMWPLIEHIEEWPFWEWETLGELFGERQAEMVAYYEGKIDEMGGIIEALKEAGVEV